jgi:hypothetical protein
MADYKPMREAPLANLIADMEREDPERWVETIDSWNLEILAERLRDHRPGQRRDRALSRVEAELEYR